MLNTSQAQPDAHKNSHIIGGGVQLDPDKLKNPKLAQQLDREKSSNMNWAQLIPYTR